MNNQIDIHHLSHALTEHGFSLRQRLQIWRSIDVSDFLCGSPGEFLVRAMKRALGEEELIRLSKRLLGEAKPSADCAEQLGDILVSLPH